MTSLLGYLGMAVIAGSLAATVFILARNPATITPKLGTRGLKRDLALQAGGIFAAIEPAVRMVAGWVAHLPIADTRVKIEKQLLHSGEWLGLSPDEYVALLVVSGAGGMIGGTVMVTILELPPGFVLFFTALGVVVPHMKMTGEIARRFKQVNRGLPTSIDLASLCMGAGLDFPGALRQIVEKAGRKDDALIEELKRILQELELGRTRRQALENFAERCPTDAVRDFVGAVTQAEEKGNPLAEVLRIQAQMLRMRRSVMAEEAAARAAVMMMLPLMLIFCAIILVLLGPFVVNAMATESQI